MKSSANVWAIILAAEEGWRLQSLAKQNNGRSVPKQFCSLDGGPTLIESAISRASRVAARHRICPIVAQRHHAWWATLAEQFPVGNIIIQPANRGTGIGILYAVMHVLARDPDALVVLIPADHFVQDESALEAAMRLALECIQRDPGSPVLLGVEPDDADADLGYIVPGEPGHPGVHRVERFVDKPSRRVAEQLAREGALWNTFILAAGGRALTAPFSQRFPSVVAQINRFLGNITADGRTTQVTWSDLVFIYQRFPVIDFAHDVLAGLESKLRVVTLPACGWSDLGTPKRVADSLERIRRGSLESETNDSDPGEMTNFSVPPSRYVDEPSL